MGDKKKSRKKNTIMVVDDNSDLVEIVRITLEGKGFEVWCAYSGKELFTGLEGQKPDLILLDIMMPQMNGLEALSRLKGDPNTASIPVILLTAKVLYEDVLGGYKTGADYYITKPFDSGQLITGINFILNRDKSHSEENLDKVQHYNNWTK